MAFTFESLNKLNLTNGEWVILKYQGKVGYHNCRISSSSGHKYKSIFDEELKHIYVQLLSNPFNTPIKLKIEKIEYFFQVKENYYPFYIKSHTKFLYNYIINKKLEDIIIDWHQNKDKSKKELLENFRNNNDLCLIKSYGNFNLLEKNRNYEVLRNNGEVMNILFEKNEIELEDDVYKFFIYYFDNNKKRKKISHFDILKYNNV